MTKTSEKTVAIPATMRSFSSLELEKLRRYKSSPNQHVRSVIEHYFAFTDIERALQDDKESDEEYRDIVQGEQIILYRDEITLKEFMPEFIDLWKLTYSYALRCVREREIDPTNEDLDPVVLNAQMKFWDDFLSVAEPRHFAYEFFYSLLIHLKDKDKHPRYFTKTYLKRLANRDLYRGLPLPDPNAFKALSVEKQVVSTLSESTEVATTAAAAKKDEKTFVPAKRPPRKDRFYCPPEPSAVSTVATSMPAVATTAIKPVPAPVTPVHHPLTEVLATGRAFLKQRTFADRVDFWLTNPAAAVEASDYQALSPQNKEAAKWRHGFSTKINAFLGTRYSVTGTWWNEKRQQEDTLHCMIAEVISDTGETERCVLQYCEDAKTRVIYHRFAGVTSNQELVDRVINRKLFEVLDFPPLKGSKQTLDVGKSAKPIAVMEGEEHITHDPITDVVTVYDPVYKLKFRLIPFS